MRFMRQWDGFHTDFSFLWYLLRPSLLPSSYLSTSSCLCFVFPCLVYSTTHCFQNLSSNLVILLLKYLCYLSTACQSMSRLWPDSVPSMSLPYCACLFLPLFSNVPWSRPVGALSIFPSSYDFSVHRSNCLCLAWASIYLWSLESSLWFTKSTKDQ